MNFLKNIRETVSSHTASISYFCQIDLILWRIARAETGALERGEACFPFDTFLKF